MLHTWIKSCVLINSYESSSQLIQQKAFIDLFVETANHGNNYIIVLISKKSVLLQFFTIQTWASFKLFVLLCVVSGHLA